MRDHPPSLEDSRKRLDQDITLILICNRRDNIESTDMLLKSLGNVLASISSRIRDVRGCILGHQCLLTKLEKMSTNNPDKNKYAYALSSVKAYLYMGKSWCLTHSPGTMKYARSYQWGGVRKHTSRMGSICPYQVNPMRGFLHHLMSFRQM